MKNRLHDKKAGIAILVSLIIISVAEVVFRHMCLRDMIATTANYAETLAVIGLALSILIFTLKGKDRLCYILYGAWAAYFMFDQFFELPANIIGFIMLLAGKINLPSFAIAIVMHASVVLSSIFTIIIGLLLVEYMNDGTIYNKAFNVLSILTSLLILLNMGLSVYDGDWDLGVAFQTHPGRQASISSGSKEPRSALESRRVSLGAHWVD